ncbi:MAG: hypothetical protein FJ087_01145 [Deltaproteobacteria bacterium]|nr:hypothetical protein [Deltaproteobacteria bacterium]
MEALRPPCPGLHGLDLLVREPVQPLPPDGVPDDRLFLDHCHPREEVHRRIAEALAGVVQSAAEARRR